MSIRVLLADDQAMVRAGFRMILESQPDIAVVGEAEDGEHALLAVQRLQPDLVLMDIQMPGVDGLEATRRITARPELTTRIVILTTFERDDYVFDALRSGASGFRARREVLRLLASGKSNAELASELFVGEGTIKTHVSNVLSKLGVRDRVQAVVFAYESGLVTPGA